MTLSADAKVKKAQEEYDRATANAVKKKKALRDALKQKRDKDKKERDHRLIEVGAILEQATAVEFTTKESRQRLSAVLNEKRVSDGREYTLGESIVLYLKQRETADADRPETQAAAGGGDGKEPPRINAITGLPEDEGGAGGSQTPVILDEDLPQ